LAYNLGRILSYMALGALFGYLGSIVSISPQVRGILFIAIGLFMVLMGISLAGHFRFLTSIEGSLGGATFMRRAFGRLLRSNSLGSFLLLGMLNGLLPCGLVYFFAASAAATGNPVWGAIVMGFFGLATTPVMLSLGMVTGFLKSSSFRLLMVKMAAIVIVLYGLYLAYKGYHLMMGMVHHSH